MAAGPLVTLIIVCVAILVIAAFLITVVILLHMVGERLTKILGAVGQVVEKTDGIEPIISEIAADLQAGDRALTACAQRVSNRYPSEEELDERSRTPVGVGGVSWPETKQAPSFRNY